MQAAVLGLVQGGLVLGQDQGGLALGLVMGLVPIINYK